VGLRSRVQLFDPFEEDVLDGLRWIGSVFVSGWFPPHADEVLGLPADLVHAYVQIAGPARFETEMLVQTTPHGEPLGSFFCSPCETHGLDFETYAFIDPLGTVEAVRSVLDA
jgi:hypothetical protein